MDMKRVYLVFCIAMVFTLLAITLGCDSSMEGYKKFTFNEVAHFTFEYPAHYRKYSAGADVIGDYRAIFIGFKDKVPSQGGTDGYIDIFVEGTGITYPDATAALEHEISRFDVQGNLLERSNIIVDGIQAELIIFSHYWEVTPDPGYSAVGAIRVRRAVYFDHNDLIWEIVIESDEDRADVAEADFEHLLETFQILD